MFLELRMLVNKCIYCANASCRAKENAISVIIGSMNLKHIPCFLVSIQYLLFSPWKFNVFCSLQELSVFKLHIKIQEILANKIWNDIINCRYFSNKPNGSQTVLFYPSFSFAHRKKVLWVMPNCFAAALAEI